MTSEKPTRIPYQMEVYFDSFPQIDVERIKRFFNECDPQEEEPLEMDEVVSDTPCSSEEQPIRVSCYSASLGDMVMGILVHSVPSPCEDTILGSRLREETKQKLLGHKAFALFTSMGGEQYPPYEQQIFLLKMAMAMCEQGATGAGYPHLQIAFPAGLLLDILNASQNEPGEEAKTLWSSIREDGEPMELFADIVAFEADGERWLATRGFAFCGFPDFIYKITPGDDYRDVAERFHSVFPYLMVHGPVIQAGHTMGYDENVAFRFADVPEDLEIPFDTYGKMLLVTKAEA